MSVDWAVVYRDTYADLVRFLYRRVWEADRAHDLAQDTFARALGQSPDNPRAWLFHVARNLANDEARTAIRRKKHLVLLKSDAESRQESAEDASAQVERGERLAQVKEALESLTERDRNALLLWDAGMDYQEIADETGLSVRAIGTTLARARRRLVEAHKQLEERHAARG